MPETRPFSIFYAWQSDLPDADDDLDGFCLGQSCACSA
jgi:hypothetical protein